MVDFTRFQSLANRLIRENGRTVTLRRLPRKSDDCDKPWRANSDDSQSEERIFPEAEADVVGVFVPGSGGGLGLTKMFDQLTPRPEQIAIIEPQDGTDDFTEYDEICDTDNLVWRVMQWEKLKPADTIVLYFAALKR